MNLDARRIFVEIARKEKTQADLAAISGVSKQNISKIFSRGKCEPKTVGKIARALGVDPSEIIKKED